MQQFRSLILVVVFALIMPACAPAQTQAGTPKPAESAVPTRPEWFDMQLTDVQTGKTFTMNDYSGKVILVGTMAMWCPSCLIQAGEVRKLHAALGNPDNLVSVSLDVDVHEDEASLKEYASSYGFDWHFAVAPLLVARALGNLYSAEYLNPPISPMLLIDRDGNVHQLDYGTKYAKTLQKFVEPYLVK